jgi:peroxiredoxin Q/BCP
MATPEEGKKAPALSLNDQDGTRVTLKDLRGKKVAIYFYPKDQTPGCTTQACNLRDNYAAVRKADIVVLGVSPDDEASHTKFIAKQDLPFTLLADPAKKALEAYGVWSEKNMYGRKYMGVVRTTFLIDESGTIVKIIAKPKVADHTREILDGFGLSA